MKWLETIHIQASDGQQKIVKKHLLDLTGQLLESDQYPGLLSVEVYKHSSLTSDHILQLRWDRDQLPQPGSVLGLQIKETMSHYGLIDHLIWCSMK